mgnify:CR=1 FL=1
MDNNLMDVYKRIKATRERRCSGCGAYNVPLSHSHIISRAKRKDLTHDIHNITYHCLSIGRVGCHDIWEHGTEEERSMMLDYEPNMAYIKKMDLSLYHQLLNRKHKR